MAWVYWLVERSRVCSSGDQKRVTNLILGMCAVKAENHEYWIGLDQVSTGRKKRRFESVVLSPSELSASGAMHAEYSVGARFSNKLLPWAQHFGQFGSRHSSEFESPRWLYRNVPLVVS
jgi:hypothetical protein